MRRISFFIVLLLVIITIGCPMGSESNDQPDNGADNDDNPSSSTHFNWASPELPEESIFSVAELKVDESASKSLSRWIASSGGSTY